MTRLSEEARVVNALKSISRNEQIKSYIQKSPDLYPILLRASKRFVAGESRKEGISKVNELNSKGYSVSLEFIGENTRLKEVCLHAKNEFLNIIDDFSSQSIEGTVSFDLSHIGLSIDKELAYKNLIELAAKAKKDNINLMISMEESTKTDEILGIYKNTAGQFDNVGITIQAHLKRSVKDIEELVNYPGEIRVVKGAYQEPEEIVFPRSKELNQKFIDLVEFCVERKHPVSIATHDQEVLRQIVDKGLLDSPCAESEMLYGVRPDLLKELKEKGYKTRVYLTYGSEWYLYLCHRLAEYPPNIYVAISDMVGHG
jgi:proline dehydrogenase